jgi:hypothetical protein
VLLGWQKRRAKRPPAVDRPCFAHVHRVGPVSAVGAIESPAATYEAPHAWQVA